MSIITVSVGQCGNQVGFEYWKQLCREHGLSDVGRVLDDVGGGDDKEVFFYESDDSHYVPRAVLIDTEPGVLKGIFFFFSMARFCLIIVLKGIQSSSYGRLFNNESIFVAGDGSGAGNNWAHGHAAGTAQAERICDMFEREAEGCDVLEGFMVTHSIAGGTGSGLGSMVLETLRERYPKKLIQTYSVFPMEDGGVNIAPYNAILAMKRLTLEADCVVVLDNTALYRVAEEQLQLPHADMSEVNQLVSTVMAASTATLRIPVGAEDFLCFCCALTVVRAF